MRPKFTYNYSPNFSTRKRNPKNIKFIVIHYTGMKSEIEAIKRLSDVNSKVSCHYFIKKSGDLVLMVPENYIAWHAGKSGWGRYCSINKCSIGIEIQNPGHNNNYSNFSLNQIKTVIQLCKLLKEKYKIKKQNFVGHSDISYERKQDPGEKFPWKLLAQNRISIWHNLKDKELKKLRGVHTSKSERIVFIKNLRKIGYKINHKQKNFKKLFRTFQMRFRNSVVNGLVDKECLIISKTLANI